jgi:hypothetical protein
LGSEAEQLVARCARVVDERGDVDAVARRREGPQALDALLEQDAGAVVVAVAPVMEAHADLEDPVIQAADRRARLEPQGLEGLVLLEELAAIELLDAAQQGVGRGIVTPCADILVDGAAGDPLRRPRRLAIAASGLGSIRRRAASGIGARRR